MHEKEPSYHIEILIFSEKNREMGWAFLSLISHAKKDSYFAQSGFLVRVWNFDAAGFEITDMITYLMIPR